MSVVAYDSLVEALAIPHRAKDAFWRLLGAGRDALPAVRAGLHHANADVRNYCCRYLDRFVDKDSMNDLMAMLDDSHPTVRAFALHALACDRCKQNDGCRIDGATVLPRAIELLRNDIDAHVRAHAIGVIGRYVHDQPTAIAALHDAMASDRSPAVRKKAAWYVPGGPIYTRTAPKPVRVKRAA